MGLYISVSKIISPRSVILHVRCFADRKTDLKAILAERIPEEQKRIKEFRKKHGSSKVCDVTVDMMYGGMRGLKGIICETSEVDADVGVTFRGYTIPECVEKLPKASCGCQPLPEGMFWLLMTGEIPTKDQVNEVSRQWALRSKIPPHVEKILKIMPNNVHPLTQLSTAVTCLNTESKFAAAYTGGVHKTEYWKYIYEDSMDLIGKLPVIAAIIYKNCFKACAGKIGIVDTQKDWSFNFTHMLGYDDPEFTDLMRLYLTIHSDHDGGNVTTHTVHLVGSALSDPYLSFAAGLNGLAGPIHGLACQEMALWIEKIKSEFGKEPTEENLKNLIQNMVKSESTIPGFGHAVLRKTDPRYVCQKQYAQHYLPNDPLYKLATKICQVAPSILEKTGKIKDPWPNGDALSGVLLRHYGMKEATFYGVLYGLARSLGATASSIWARALGFPIERPKSLSSTDLIKTFQSKK